jgi:hypothetical protein
LPPRAATGKSGNCSKELEQNKGAGSGEHHGHEIDGAPEGFVFAHDGMLARPEFHAQLLENFPLPDLPPAPGLQNIERSRLTQSRTPLGEISRKSAHRAFAGSHPNPRIPSLLAGAKESAAITDYPLLCTWFAMSEFKTVMQIRSPRLKSAIEVLIWFLARLFPKNSSVQIRLYDKN